MFNNKKGTISSMTVLLIVFVTAWFIFFPLGMRLLDSNNYATLSDSDYSKIKTSNGVLSAYGNIGIYFKYLTFDVPNAPTWARAITIFITMLAFFAVLVLSIEFLSVITGAVGKII